MQQTHKNKPSIDGQRLYFEKMFKDQEKQIQNNKHIQSLLSPKEVDTSKEHSTKLLEKKLDHIEALVHSIQINQKSTKPEIKTVTIDNTPKKYYFITGAIIISGLLIAIALSSQPTKVEKVIVKTEKPIVNDILTPKRSVLLKFGNLRQTPSSRGNIITTIAPNSIVIIKEQKKDWTKIEFKNHIQNKIQSGWIYNEILKPIL